MSVTTFDRQTFAMSAGGRSLLEGGEAGLLPFFFSSFLFDLCLWSTLHAHSPRCAHTYWKPHRPLSIFLLVPYISLLDCFSCFVLNICVCLMRPVVWVCVCLMCCAVLCCVVLCCFVCVCFPNCIFSYDYALCNATSLYIPLLFVCLSIFLHSIHC